MVWGARPSGLGGPCHRSGPLKGLAAATVTKHRNRNTEAQRMPSLGPPTWRTLVSAAGRRGVDDEEPGITPRTWPVPDRRSGHRVRRRARPVVRRMEEPGHFGNHERPDAVVSGDEAIAIGRAVPPVRPAEGPRSGEAAKEERRTGNGDASGAVAWSRRRGEPCCRRLW